MYRFSEEDTFRDLESVIRETMRTQSLWDEAHEEEQIAGSDVTDVQIELAAAGRTSGDVLFGDAGNDVLVNGEIVIQSLVGGDGLFA